MVKTVVRMWNQVYQQPKFPSSLLISVHLRTFPLEPSSSPTVAPVVLVGVGAVVAAFALFALLSPSALTLCFFLL